MKIISGGQTGVDRAALDAAFSLGVARGGWCPAGRLAEDGLIPPHYPLEEFPGGGYLERTAQNVSAADGTVIFHHGLLCGGSKATADFCVAQGKPCLQLDASRLAAPEAAAQLREFVRANQLATLNVAGPRASEWEKGYDFAGQTMRALLDSAPPKISFVVPAHNEEHELPATLRALQAAAATARETYELIVVDDASTDATAEIARQFDARVISIDRRQIAAARNAGARIARGQFLFFVDADTQIAPGHITEGLAALADGCVGGGARVALDSDLSFWHRAFVRAFCGIYFGVARLAAGAFIFTRRATFEAVGGFDEQYFAGEEVYFSLALKKLGRFRILREPIVTSARKLRMHSGGSVLVQSFFVVVGGKRSLRNRKRLALWYDGKRERPAA